MALALRPVQQSIFLSFSFFLSFFLSFVLLAFCAGCFGGRRMSVLEDP